MIKHIILWQLKDEYTKEQKEQIKKEIKESLENLQGKIPGLQKIQVYTDGLSSSNADLMLDSSFENEECLKGYGVHPEHVKAADEKVRPYIKQRVCMDYRVSN